LRLQTTQIYNVFDNFVVGSVGALLDSNKELPIKKHYFQEKPIFALLESQP
jgi:hypothetical protein